MREANIVMDLPDLIEITEEAYREDQISPEKLHCIRSADRVFMSDSGDSFVTYHHMHDGKWQTHTFSRVGGKDVMELVEEAIAFIEAMDVTKSIWFFCKDKRAKLLIGSQFHKYKDRATIIDLKDNERVYILEK